jgi:hexosaminidase
MILSVVVTALASAAPQQEIAIIPRPAVVAPMSEAFVLRDPVRIVVGSDAGELREVAGFLRDLLSEKTAYSVSLVSRSDAPAIAFEQLAAPAGSSSSPEAYELAVTSTGVRIRAPSAAGAFWGVQSLRQLLPPDIERGVRRSSWRIPAANIADRPRFAWRGSMLDAGRHFFPVASVKRQIDLLALLKMNVFHWHLTEDQGWRLEINQYPRLTSVGAWRTETDGTRYGGFYTQAEVRDVVEYARQRHVTIVPEIEMPGHSTAALVAYPEFSCTGASKEVPATWGVFEDVYCPGKEETFRFLENVLDEVMALFPSKVIHIGGDEVPKDHWKACASCQKRMQAEGLKDERELQSYFIKRIDTYVRSKEREITGWDEILEGGLAPGAAVQVWRDIEHARTTVKLGNRAVSSPTSHAYLNRSPAELSLSRVYEFNPVPDGLTAEEAARIAGGEATFWSEGIDDANFDAMAFPRIAAMAEALWSGQPGVFAGFKARLDRAFYQRLTALGVSYGPEDQRLLALTPVFDPVSTKVGVRIEQHIGGLAFHYTTDGTMPATRSPLYRETIQFETPGTVRVQPFLKGKPMIQSAALTIERHLAVGRTVTLTIPNSPKYPGTGAFTLTDSLHGSMDFHDSLWQGWEGDDMEAVVDLGKLTPIREVELTTLQVMRSWILLPRRVLIWLSDDGAAWRPVADLTHDVPHERDGSFPHRFSQSLPAGTRARYVKVRAVNAGPLPAWHPGAGGKAWVFADEVSVR